MPYRARRFRRDHFVDRLDVDSEPIGFLALLLNLVPRQNRLIEFLIPDGNLHFLLRGLNRLQLGFHGIGFCWKPGQRTLKTKCRTCCSDDFLGSVRTKSM